MSRGYAPRRIDWSEKLRVVDGRLTGRGGVIKVATEAESASSIFAKLIEQRISQACAKSGDHRVQVQVDQGDPNVHYAENLLGELEQQLGIGRPESLTGAPGAAVALAQNVRGGKVEIHDNEVHVHDHGGAQTDAAIRKRARRLAAHVKQRAKRALVCIVLLDSHEHSPSTLMQFTKLLWEPALSKLSGHGLVLIDVGTPDGRNSEFWPPQPPDEVIKLPASFDARDRDAAIRDIAEIALEEGACEGAEAARVFTRMMLADEPIARDVHARLAYRLAEIKEPWS